MDGILNLLKPPGMTSHDAVAFVRRALNIKRVGHTGTLDPAAAGVLPVCIGQATRLVEYLQGGTKEYIAEATFGFETDSGDAVGTLVAQGDASTLDLETLRGALDSFRGKIVQTPPLHSAIKVGGQKLYDLARAGKTDVEIPTREVFITQLLATKFWKDENGVRAMLQIECSGGTYIRSLVRDIGRVLGSRATMTFLVRTRSGAFDIQSASTLEQIENAASSAMIAMPTTLGWCARVVVENDEATACFSQGKLFGFDKIPTCLEEHLRDPDAAKLRETKARQSGNDRDSKQIVVINSQQSVAAIASCTPENAMVYKPEKVFFLKAGN